MEKIQHVYLIVVANHAPFPILHVSVTRLAFYSWSWEIHMKTLIQNVQGVQSMHGMKTKLANTIIIPSKWNL